MSILENLPESLHAPLKVFVEELSGHIDFFEKILAEPPTGDDEMEITRKKIEGRFHLVRGGSGFFKLDSLKNLSARGEEDFRKTKGEPDKFEELFNTFFIDAVAQIKAEHETLKAELGLA